MSEDYKIITGNCLDKLKELEEHFGILRVMLIKSKGSK